MVVDQLNSTGAGRTTSPLTLSGSALISPWYAPVVCYRNPDDVMEDGGNGPAALSTGGRSDNAGGGRGRTMTRRSLFLVPRRDAIGMQSGKGA